jgi:hypothetical protein
VSIPQPEGDPQTSQTHPTDGPGGSPSISTRTGSLVSKSSLTKKVCQSKSPSDKAATGRKKTLPSKRRISARSASKDAPVPQRTKTKRAKATPDHTVDVLSKRTTLDHLIPQRSKKRKSSKSEDSSDKVRQGRTLAIPPRLTTPDNPMPQLDLMKEPPRNENALDNAEPDRTVETLLKQPPVDFSLPPHPPAEDTLQAEESSDDLAPDRTVGVPSWMMSPSSPDSRWNSMTEPAPSDDASSQAERDLTEGVSRIDQDQGMMQHSSVEEPRQTENVSDKVAPRRKSWVPPKLTIQDHPISPGPSTSKPEQAENARAQVASDGVNKVRSESSLGKKLYQAEDIEDTFAPDRTAKTSPTPKSVEPDVSQNVDSEKRYGPEAPPKEVAPAGQQETTVSPKASGPSLWQQISNRLFAPKPGANPTRQKVAVISIPILAIIMIFALRQVLSKSPRKTKGDTAKDATLIVPADVDQEIDWQIPEPLPTTMRDPTKLPAESNTHSEDQEPTAVATESELIDIGTIVYSHDKQSAVVNGRIVHAGETVSGLTVLKINRDSVEFEKNGEKWIQKIRD